MRHTLIGIVLLGLAASSCTAPANVRGDYQGNVVNGTSSCPRSWTNGATSTVTFRVGQSDADITIEIQGTSGIAVEALLGSRVFQGTVEGDQVTAKLIGTREQTQGSCR